MLQVQREPCLFDALDSWSVLVDGIARRTLTRNGSVSIEVPPGPHTVEIAASTLRSSRSLLVALGDGATVRLRCGTRTDLDAHPAARAWFARLRRPGIAPERPITLEVVGRPVVGWFGCD